MKPVGLVDRRFFLRSGVIASGALAADPLNAIATPKPVVNEDRLPEPKSQKPKIVDLSDRTRLNLTREEVRKYMKFHNIKFYTPDQWTSISDEIKDGYVKAIDNMNKALYKLEEVQDGKPGLLIKVAALFVPQLANNKLAQDILKYSNDFNEAIGNLRVLEIATKERHLLELEVDLKMLHKNPNFDLLDLRIDNTTLIDIGTKSKNNAR